MTSFQRESEYFVTMCPDSFPHILTLLVCRKLATICRPDEECCDIYEQSPRKRILIPNPPYDEDLLLRH
jgi:hypothetical protein